MVLSDAIHKVYPSAPMQTLFTVPPGYEPTSKSSQQRNVESNLPPLLTSLYNHKHTQCTSHELDKLSEAVHETLAIKYSLDEISFVEKCNSEQSHSLYGLTIDLHWPQTMSMFGQIAKRTERMFPISLVKSIMQYISAIP